MILVEPKPNNLPTNFLIKKKGFSVSYNELKGTPNFVIWDIDEFSYGDIKRSETFFTEKLPKGFYRPRERAYIKQGFDRGHLCPAEDRSFDQELSRETFFMSNIVPQVPKLNQRTWKFLEDYCKKLCVKNKSKLQCVAGVLGIKSTIARGFITVPEYFFKVVHVRTVDNLEQLICVIIPNDENVNLNWKTYECNLDTLQVLTGLNFSFSQ